MDIKKSVKDSLDNTRDAAREVIHRSTADAERAHRELDGDEMTGGRKSEIRRERSQEPHASGNG